MFSYGFDVNRNFNEGFARVKQYLYPKKRILPILWTISFLWLLLISVSSQKRRRIDNLTSATPSKYDGIKRGDMTWLKNPEDFFLRLEHEKPQSKCQKLVAVGGFSCGKNRDGHKMVCLDQDVTLKPKNCTIYSIGLANDLSFDDAIAKFNCEVYMLDPTLPDVVKPIPREHQKFFPIGISTETKTFEMNITSYEEWQGVMNVSLMPFDKIQDAINHHDAVHYLKMDVENHEWSVLKYMMQHNQLRNIKQLAVEFHGSNFIGYPPEKRLEYLRKKWKIIEDLEDHGFKRSFYAPTQVLDSMWKIPGTEKAIFVTGELFLVNRPD